MRTSIVRDNLMNVKWYSPYCGSETCSLLNRTKFNGEQFVCENCGWVSKFPEDFIKEYKKKWNH